MSRSVCYVFVTLSALSLVSRPAFAYDCSNWAVQVSAVVQESPAKITLSWPQATGTTRNSHTIYRRSEGATTWGTAVATLGGTTLTWDDSSVSAGQVYEYRIVAPSADGSIGYGYISAAIKLPYAASRGKVILLVDNTLSSGLSTNITRLIRDLNADGWVVLRHDVQRNAGFGNPSGASAIRSVIQADYNADPSNVKCVYILGNIPVPYSGDTAWDGHSTHKGAWSADTYYADLNGTWTDTTVNDTSSGNARTSNTPGDGKFDQSYIPSDVELQVGRVDCSKIDGSSTGSSPSPGPNFTSELNMTNRYLDKDHNFRVKSFDMTRHALLSDTFGSFSNDAFAASGWRSFSTFFGAANTYNCVPGNNPGNGEWIDSLVGATTYLCAYGCGPGVYNGSRGLGHYPDDNGGNTECNTTDLINSDPKACFFMLFGSSHGDWDNYDNFQRAVLCTPTYGLTSCWSGVPHWYMHYLGIGYNTGYCAKMSMNNAGDANSYQNQAMMTNSCRGAHQALTGDPTLRIFTVYQPTNFTVSGTVNNVLLSWTASTDTNIQGYDLYRFDSGLNTVPVKVNSSGLITGTNYTDTAGNPSTVYLLRAVKLETTASGTFYNPSQGVFSDQGSAPTNYTLAASASPGGSGSVALNPSGGTYAAGTAVTVTASANSGYNFSSWSGGASGTGNPATVTMASNLSVTANFSYSAPTTYSLSVNVAPSGAGTVGVTPFSGSYTAGTVVTLTASANSGYNFSSWSGGASGSNSPVTVTMNSNLAVTANFAASIPGNYTLTASANPVAGGSVALSPAGGSYAAGTTVTLTSTANSGYAFASWSGALTGAANPSSLILNSNRSATANFTAAAPAAYTLTVTVSPSGSGTVAANPDQSTYTAGTLVSLTATANQGYSFASWTGAASGTDTSAQVTVNSNVAATAMFSEANPSEGGVLNGAYNYSDTQGDSTNFIVSLKQPSTIDMRIYTIGGKMVNSLSQSGNAGDNSFIFSNVLPTGKRLVHGLYVYSIEATGADGTVETRTGKFVVQ